MKPHKAESAVVRPAPPTLEAIDANLTEFCERVDVASMIHDHTPGANYIGGLQGGIALAIDHPEAARLVLAAIDARKRDDAIENGSLDPDGEVAEDAEVRAELMEQLANAALGINATLPGSNWLN